MPQKIDLEEGNALIRVFENPLKCEHPDCKKEYVKVDKDGERLCMQHFKEWFEQHYKITWEHFKEIDKIL